MTKKILYLIAALLFVLVSYQGYEYYTFIEQRNQLVKEKGAATTAALRDQVDGILSKIVTEAERLAALLGQNEYSAEQIENLIKESALSIPEIQGVTACYEPYSFAQSKRLYCPYYDKGTQEYLYVEKNYDYTVKGAKGTDWYTGVREEGAKWVEPYFAQAAKDWYIDYGIPFYFGEGPNQGKVRGTITMSFIASGFKNLIHALSLGKTGYGLITSQAGVFLAHPINEYVGKTKLERIKANTQQPELVAAYEGLLAGQTGNIEFYDEAIDDHTLFYYDKIPSSGWGIGLLFYKNDLLEDQLALNRRYIKMALLFSAFLIFLIAIHFNKDYLDQTEIWQLSILASILLLSNIWLIGYLKHTTLPTSNPKQSPPIVDNASLNGFIHEQHLRADTLKIPKATPIPTGIYVQRLEFENSYNLNVGGTVWQKYPLDKVETVTVGFRFPQMSPFAEAAYVEESYRELVEAKEDEAGYLLVGWEFRVTLRLNLNYANYPFDKRHLSIDIVPMNNQDHLLFIPDLASYTYTNPFKKSGLQPSIEISGNEVLESYFNFSLETYDADFGYGRKELYEEVPVLHFNINLRRILLNAFVTYLIPIFVTLVMMFILIFACGKTEERQGIIESMAAFFFVLIFSHIDMRKEIITADLIYMEYFYFITYFMIIISTFNLITYTKNKTRFFDFNENQIFKAIYFPLFFLSVLILTLLKFY